MRNIRNIHKRIKHMDSFIFRVPVLEYRVPYKLRVLIPGFDFHRFLYVYRFCKIFAQNCLLPFMKPSLIRKLFRPPSKCIFLKAINYLNWWGIRKISQTWEIVNCISRCSTEELIRHPFYTTNSTSIIPNSQQNKSAFSHVFIFYRFYKDFKLLP